MVPHGVSILVVLDWAWGLLPSRAVRCRLGVSILVVLDWAWGPPPPIAHGQAQGGFNPCCIGLGVGTG